MRKLDVSAITASIGMPLKSGSLVHLQAAYQEALMSIGQCLVGSGFNPAIMYVLFGCVNTGSGSTFNMSEGAVFFNGEIYQVPAAAFTVPGGQTVVANIVTSFFSASNADSVQFTDGVARNVHQIRQVICTAGLSGSGTADYGGWQTLNINQATLNLEGTGIATVSGTFPNLVVDVPAPTPVGIIAMDKVHLGDIPGGGLPLTIVFRTPTTTANYIVLGSFFSNGVRLIDSAVGFDWYTPTIAGFDATFSETASGVQDVTFCYVVVAFS